MDETRWLILRDIDIFRPNHHQLVICERDLSIDVMEGHRERRNKFTVDCWTGKSWGRQGSGRYTKWSAVPPSGMMISTFKKPTPNKNIVICVTLPQYFGIRIGRLNNAGFWQVFSDILGDYVVISPAHIEGWLPLT